MNFEWTPVVFADQCPPCKYCGEPWCSQCESHYADCECPGPTQDDEYDYNIFNGVIYAKPKEQ